MDMETMIQYDPKKAAAQYRLLWKQNEDLVRRNKELEWMYNNMKRAYNNIPYRWQKEMLLNIWRGLVFPVAKFKTAWGTVCKPKKTRQEEYLAMPFSEYCKVRSEEESARTCYPYPSLPSAEFKPYTITAGGER